MNEPVTTSAKIAIFQQLAKSEGTPMTSASENHHSTATKEDSNLQSDSLGYSYFDRGSLTIELNEFYSYLEIPELKLGGHLFETSFTITSNWRECSLEDRSFYISTLLNEVDSCSFAKCRRAAQILLYISLGVFNEAQNTRELLDTMTSNNQLIAENGGLQLFFAQIVRNATQIKKSASNFSKYHSKDLRVFLNLVYNMLIFCGTLLEKDCKEPIYLNLSPREVVTELLLDYHKPEAQSYPINKLLLLLWRLLLLNFNKGKFYRENIEEEPNSPCTCKHRSHHYSLRVKDRPRWQLKANLDDIYKFFKKTETKNYDYFNFSSASFTSENMFPLPIQEARSLLKKKLNFSKNNEVTDPQVRAFMDFLSPQLPSFITLLLKIMLASQPNTKSPGSVRILGFLSWGPSKSKSMSSTTPKLIDALRHKEILTKAVSAIFVTLLEHFKQEDLHEYEYLSERIIADNGLLLLIMILKNWRTFFSLPKYNFQSHNWSPDAEESKTCWRNYFVIVTVLRILQYVTNAAAVDKNTLIKYKLEKTLLELVGLNNDEISYYCYKLLKKLLPYLLRKWRGGKKTEEALKKTLSGISLRVGTKFGEDWTVPIENGFEMVESDELYTPKRHADPIIQQKASPSLYKTIRLSDYAKFQIWCSLHQEDFFLFFPHFNKNSTPYFV